MTARERQSTRLEDGSAAPAMLAIGAVLDITPFYETNAGRVSK